MKRFTTEGAEITEKQVERRLRFDGKRVAGEL
jgi:hypothetical protein